MVAVSTTPITVPSRSARVTAMVTRSLTTRPVASRKNVASLLFSVRSTSAGRPSVSQRRRVPDTQRASMRTITWVASPSRSGGPDTTASGQCRSGRVAVTTCSCAAPWARKNRGPRRRRTVTVVAIGEKLRTATTPSASSQRACPQSTEITVSGWTSATRPGLATRRPTPTLGTCSR